MSHKIHNEGELKLSAGNCVSDQQSYVDRLEANNRLICGHRTVLRNVIVTSARLRSYGDFEDSAKGSRLSHSSALNDCASEM